MTESYRSLMFTPSVRAAQRAAYGRDQVAAELPFEGLAPAERAFLQARDSFYLASVGEQGWPYVQHRGGPRGFLRVLDERRLLFADRRGNRQLISVGNLATDDRVSLIAVDYPTRRRLKLVGRARVLDLDALPPEAFELDLEGADRLIEIEVVGVDWNCPQHIVPRFTAEEVEEYVRPLRDRIRELESRLS
ncbi:MAG: pyridoxamine 5'-phosphate oxidase family protein [Planctomycetota bacterium]